VLQRCARRDTAPDYVFIVTLEFQRLTASAKAHRGFRSGGNFDHRYLLQVTRAVRRFESCLCKLLLQVRQRSLFALGKGLASQKLVRRECDDASFQALSRKLRSILGVLPTACRQEQEGRTQ